MSGKHRAPAPAPAPAPVTPEAGTRSRRRWVVPAAVALVLLVAVPLLVLRPWQSEPVASSSDWPPGDWNQVFGDEFDGERLDPDVWDTDRADRGGDDLAAVPFNPVIEDAWFDPDNATLADGNLVLTVEEEQRSLFGQDYAYSSGMVQSTPALTLEPTRYVEARIRFPGCSGCWPAFWLHPQGQWPPEIDIAEFLESGSESRPSFNYIQADEQKTGPDMYGDPDVDYRDDFHTYGVLWDGVKAVPYVDGVAQDALTADENMTSVPMMIILNLSVRGGYQPPPGVSMLVDWVRVWEPSA
ncbi:glycoside hydrolase family 16 protein [Blastococcus atacamensis]|uniref:glycoside hydrolase family 16 protein n=1 Tax=Blastococcus atacamensis TaxID=2070508 RepID=UPI0012FFF06A|nr:glycoside hydrolase family 16 protein [Blastococcus atacamensis]